MASNKLEQAALQQRGVLIPLNTYNHASPNNEYSGQHPNALGDGDIKGKGTGIFLDILNGGGDLDINGNPNYAGSGRIQNVAVNQYNSNQAYTAPDTSGNVGQVIL